MCYLLLIWSVEWRYKMQAIIIVVAIQKTPKKATWVNFRISSSIKYAFDVLFMQIRLTEIMAHW